MKFRTDINGLRALAVIAVVLFHFNPTWVPGGFAGVDVFFVISGFLMTGIIFRGFEKNNFSIINFYIARANRIIPSLSVVCLVLLVFGWFYLTPLNYSMLGKHIASSMGFLSNVIYWREAGYFDTASHSKWLLHTWSLSVEWQFYIIYPVVLVLLKKYMPLNNIKLLLIIGTMLGFIFSAYITYRWPNPAYFLLPTRAWEMMVGGLAFLYPLQSLKETSKKYLEWFGIALILSSYAFISKDNYWPGYLALIPVLGAYLVIVANRSGSVITDNVLMQKVGLWSYSIYLWHWPVMVFGYNFEIQHWAWIGIPVSFVLGFCSYKFVESIKFPALSTISFKTFIAFKPLWIVVSLGLVSSYIFIEHGIPKRFQSNINYIEDFASSLSSSQDNNVKKLREQCEVGDLTSKGCNKFEIENNVAGIIIGDSHAQAISSGIYKSLKSKYKGKELLNLGAFGCLPIYGVIHSDPSRKNCSVYNDKLYSFLKSHYDGVPVILAARLNIYPFGFNESNQVNKPYIYLDGYNKFSNNYLDAYKKDFIKSVCDIHKNHPVYILKPIPEFIVNVPETMVNNLLQNKKT
ncbi:acyltransferase family protein [Photobacterium kishitanii]|uniref:acyltransferase family protein n=1 Tax=Photobacterium kishitanii TaxID=318456 RepID=UPI0006964E1C|nr:acyltransferase family protein [Photobacterium kishitanii]